MPTLITGSSGRIGRRVLEALGQTAISVKAAKRKPVTSIDVAFDWDQPQTWPGALKGTDTVFLMTPEALGDVSNPAVRFLKMAKEAGVNRTILLSALGADKDDHGTGMKTIETAVRSAFADHCILRPNTFMQNFSEGPFHGSIVKNNTLVAPVGDSRISFIDLRDIADCIAAALIDPTIKGTYTLTGDEAISFAQAAAHISNAAGRQIRFENPTDAEMSQLLQQTGMPPHLVAMILGFYKSLREPRHSEIINSVGQLIGKPPRRFASFALENAEAWKNDL